MSDWDNYRRKAKVKRIIDGDTIEVQVDLGFTASVTIPVRIKDCNAPETRRGTPRERRRGKMVMEKLETLLQYSHNAVLIDSEGFDRSFERWVCSVRTEGGTDLAKYIRKATKEVCESDEKQYPTIGR